MLVLMIGVIALVVAYFASHFVFLSGITPKRRLFFFVLSVFSFYIAIGSSVFTFSNLGG
ncbi:hypothetical protein [Staphylococcus capitis]|uniref:Uncharacterized protein n=1 Tax=Staphylococcus capitis TaxID=29388 RepID=A0ABX1SQ86_STACP|nr:hypothetical protein [Staphylococcus capitis]NMK53965.1 hypothetical protein [Staphylococcus capitis]NMK69342.1 hypothetical protein [Staphylococcus capitis]